MEYVLTKEFKEAYLCILFILCLIVYLIADIKYKIYKLGSVQNILCLTDNQMKLISILLIGGGLWGLSFFYEGFVSVKVFSDTITLRYLKPKFDAVLSKDLIDRYEVSISEHKDTKGNRGLEIYLTNGKKYKSTGVGPEQMEILNQLSKQLDILINNKD